MTRIALDPLGRDPAMLRALERLWSVLPEARLVGGVVRDLIAGDVISDLDLGGPDPPESLIRRLSDAGIRSLPTGLAHGTITALLEGHSIEITSLRRDERTDGRHAVVAWTRDWREDAQRRDFTINAMSLSRDGTLFDYFDGMSDLKAGRVRFVGDAERRIAEDALRILRFFRFNARFGRGVPNAAATRAIADAASSLRTLSAERVWSELRRILIGPRLEQTLSLMRRLGVLDRLLPTAAGESRAARVPPDPILRLAALLDGSPARVSEALRLSRSESARLEALLAPPVLRHDLDDDELRRLLADASAELLYGRAWLAQARTPPDSDGSDPDAWEHLRQRLRNTPRPVFPLAGRDLLASGVGPGPEIGRLLRETRAWWQAAGCVAGRDACLGHLRALTGLPPDAPGCGQGHA